MIDMIAYTEEDALSLLRSVKGFVKRVLIVSSADVYRAYDRWRKVYGGPLELVPLTEDAPLREALYPYRDKAKGPADWLYHYEKILVEKAALSDPDIEGTVLRLPFVYGPGDYQHREREHPPEVIDPTAFDYTAEDAALKTVSPMSESLSPESG